MIWWDLVAVPVAVFLSMAGATHAYLSQNAVTLTANALFLAFWLWVFLWEP